LSAAQTFLINVRIFIMSIISLSLSKLVPSSLNVRKTGGASLDDLAASIMAHGLIQCLNVRPATGGKYEVVAGGRRLAALKRLAKEKRIPKSFAVSCRVLDEEDSTEISLAENQVRQAMHPADQFDAFRTLSDNGMSNADIAARFGATERTVEQRLKLASVSPALFALYRADEMTLEQLMAFTLTDDHARQEAVWASVSDSYDSGAYAIRRRLTETKVSSDDKRARLIGEEAFRAAGGTITRDLFAVEGESFFEDATLLERLVAERLEEAAATVQAEGWAWVEVAQDDRYGVYQPIPAHVRDFTEEEQVKMDALVAEADEIALDDSGSEEEEARHTELCERMDVLEAACRSFPEELRAASGAVIRLDYDGSLRIERGFVRRDAVSAPSETDSPAKSKPEFSASLLQELTAHRTQALQAALARDPSTALDCPRALPRFAELLPAAVAFLRPDHRDDPLSLALVKVRALKL
jgi:ParB family transcriptional regulator, chromosome partitioning protein